MEKTFCTKTGIHRQEFAISRWKPQNGNFSGEKLMIRSSISLVKALMDSWFRQLCVQRVPWFGWGVLSFLFLEQLYNVRENEGAASLPNPSQQVIKKNVTYLRVYHWDHRIFTEPKAHFYTRVLFQQNKQTGNGDALTRGPHFLFKSQSHQEIIRDCRNLIKILPKNSTVIKYEYNPQAACAGTYTFQVHGSSQAMYSRNQSLINTSVSNTSVNNTAVNNTGSIEELQSIPEFPYRAVIGGLVLNSIPQQVKPKSTKEADKERLQKQSTEDMGLIRRSLLQPDVADKRLMPKQVYPGMKDETVYIQLPAAYNLVHSRQISTGVQGDQHIEAVQGKAAGNQSITPFAADNLLMNNIIDTKGDFAEHGNLQKHRRNTVPEANESITKVKMEEIVSWVCREIENRKIFERERKGLF